jgi:hypothetical protein
MATVSRGGQERRLATHSTICKFESKAEDSERSIGDMYVYNIGSSIWVVLFLQFRIQILGEPLYLLSGTYITK